MPLAVQGQEPNMADLQEMLYITITGERPSSEMKTDSERLVALTRAAAGIKALLILDDAWSMQHVEEYWVPHLRSSKAERM